MSPLSRIFSIVFLLTFTVGDVSLNEDKSCCSVPEITTSPGDIVPLRMAFILGAQKSGTTFLYDELVSRHPYIKGQVVMGAKKLKVNGAKEPHYWHQVFPDPLASYTRSYSFGGRRNLSDPMLTFIDGTPDYLHLPTSACRISKAFPNAKLIIVLRDPVMRALSQWNMLRVIQGRERVSNFDLEVKKELSALRNKKCSFEAPAASVFDKTLTSRIYNMSWKPRDLSIPSWSNCFRCQFMWCGTYHGDANVKTEAEAFKKCKHDYPETGFIRKGLYAYQIEHWLKFFPADNFLILNHEQLQKEPEALLDRTIAFLEHDVKLKRPLQAKGDNTIQLAGKAVHKAFVNKTSSGWSLPMSDRNAYKDYAATLDFLYRYYARPNENLYQLLWSLGSRVGWSGKFPTSNTGNVTTRRRGRRRKPRNVLPVEGDNAGGVDPKSII